MRKCDNISKEFIVIIQVRKKSLFILDWVFFIKIDEIIIFSEALPAEKCIMNHVRNCTEDVKKAYKVILTPSDVAEGICENFNQDIESTELIDDIFSQGYVNSKYLLKKLYHL